jgi:hypothetical protein
MKDAGFNEYKYTEPRVPCQRFCSVQAYFVGATKAGEELSQSHTLNIHHTTAMSLYMLGAYWHLQMACKPACQRLASTSIIFQRGEEKLRMG